MLIPILTMSIMGLLFGLGLAYASKIFEVKTDPKMDLVLHALPGSNCGACGKAGCAGLAESIVKGESGVTSCIPGGEEVSHKIADILGIEKSYVSKKAAFVRCGGGKRAKNKYIYEGVKTCQAADLLGGGEKKCGFACLGFGDCVKVCPFDAIYMGQEGLPIVVKDKCTACGKCVKSCPKSIIILQDIKHNYYVKCISKDNLQFVKDACPVGCIACRVCEKLSKGAFVVEHNLARLDYNKVDSTTPLGLCASKCPTKCINSHL